MTSMNVSMPESLREFVEAEVAKGKFGTASEYIRSLIRREARKNLEELLLEGLNSGPATPMTKEDWADIRREVRERLAAERRKRKRTRRSA